MNFTRTLIFFKDHSIFKFRINDDLVFELSKLLDGPSRITGPPLIPVITRHAPLIGTPLND